MCEGLHDNEIAHLESFKGIDSLFEKWFSHGQSSLTILLNVFSNLLFFHRSFGFDIDHFCNLLNFFGFTIYLFHRTVHLLGFLFQNGSQIVQLYLHLLNHDLSFIQLIHTLFILAPFLLDLFILSCQDFFKEFKHACEHNWRHIYIFLLFGFVLFAEPHNRLMNLSENIANPLPESHRLYRLFFFISQIVRQLGLIFSIEIHACF